MRRLLLAILAQSLTALAFGQAQLQYLTPTRLAIFKNGTSFVKREARVTVANQSFLIPAPQQALLGTYWISLGKEATLRAAVTKVDIIRVQRTINQIEDHLHNAIGQTITLYRDVATPALQVVTGVLRSYNKGARLLTLQMPQGQTLVADVADFQQITLPGSAANTFMGDSLVAYTKISVDKPISNITAGTLALERGIDWYASYLVRILNDKEARIEMKATIVNRGETYLNTPVDIIIGSPEMFFGNTLDPSSVKYLMNDLVPVGNDNNFNYTRVSLLNTTSQAVGSYSNGTQDDDEDEEAETKDGENLEDLFYYRLGTLDLEKNASVMVPVLTATVTYKDLYTTNLATNSTDEEATIPVFHDYQLTNTTAAPFTTGAALILTGDDQPQAQSRVTYTPVKGKLELRLSKALDVAVKNEETEQRREKLIKNPKYNSTLDKIWLGGNISVTNFKKERITIRMRKSIKGTAIRQSDNGSFRKKGEAGNNALTLLEWEVVIEPGATKEITYEYMTIQ